MLGSRCVADSTIVLLPGACSWAATWLRSRRCCGSEQNTPKREPARRGAKARYPVRRRRHRSAPVPFLRGRHQLTLGRPKSRVRAVYSGSSSGSNVSGSVRAPIPTPVSGLGISSPGAGRSRSGTGRSPVAVMGFPSVRWRSVNTLPAYHDAGAGGHRLMIGVDGPRCLSDRPLCEPHRRRMLVVPPGPSRTDAAEGDRS